MNDTHRIAPYESFCIDDYGCKHITTVSSYFPPLDTSMPGILDYNVECFDRVVSSNHFDLELGTFERTNSSPGTNLLVQAPSRRKAHSQAAWNEIRPIFTYLYIDLNMTLVDVRHRILQKHGFDATYVIMFEMCFALLTSHSLQMYKKRIDAWGLRKNATTEDNEIVIEQILDGTLEFKNLDHISIRRDKLVRFLNTRIKLSTSVAGGRCSEMKVAKRQQNRRENLAPERLSKLKKILKATTFTSTRNNFPTSNSGPCFWIDGSLGLPDDLAGSDLYLRAVKELIHFMNDKPPSLYHLSNIERIDYKLSDHLVDGEILWNNHAFSQARQHFYSAGQLIIEELRRGSMDIAPIVMEYLQLQSWDGDAQEVYYQFRQFLKNASAVICGENHPFSIIVRHKSDDMSNDERRAMWDCAVTLSPPPNTPSNANQQWLIA